MSLWCAPFLKLCQSSDLTHGCTQITSPSGKALFQWRAEEDGSVDFYICALSFGQNAIGQRQRIGATVSVYLNGTFVWCACHANDTYQSQ